MNERVENKKGCEILSTDIRLNRRHMQQEMFLRRVPAADRCTRNSPRARSWDWATGGGGEPNAPPRSRGTAEPISNQ